MAAVIVDDDAHQHHWLPQQTWTRSSETERQTTTAGTATTTGTATTSADGAPLVGRYSTQVEVLKSHWEMRSLSLPN
jgi:hypothetical protein